MKHSLGHKFKVLLTIAGALLSFFSHVSLATNIETLADENVSQVVTVAEQREQLLAEYSQDESLTLDQRIAATVNLGMYYGPNSIIAVARALTI